MFGKKVIAFQSTKGVYKNTIKPYQSWHESISMSRILEIEGNYN